jgi:hypothetical protein
VKTAPVIVEVQGDALEALERRNEELQAGKEMATGYPGWDGERIDYMWTVNAVFGGTAV